MKSVVFTFGRFQGLTIGHQKLVKTLVNVAKQHNAEARIYTSSTQDSSRNPLPYDFKIKMLKTAFPEANVINDKSLPTAFQILTKFQDEGIRNVYMVVGQDRVGEFKSKIEKYIKPKSDPSYNPSKNYDFDHFEVISAGNRNENATDVTGASGTKMREFVKTDNFKEFLKNFPSKNVAFAREVFTAMKRNLKEDVDIQEGLNDPGIFKAIFLAGGPGSGKDYILRMILSGAPLREINSDTVFEILMAKAGKSLIMKDFDPEKDMIRGKAKETTKERQRLAVQGRLGLVINGTGDNVSKFVKIKEELESLGYETAMVFVNTTDEVSRKRNIARGASGGRTVPETIRSESWNLAQKNKNEYRKIFPHFIEVDNSTNADSSDLKTSANRFEKLYKYFRAFIAKPVNNRAAINWINDTAQHRNITKVVQSKSSKFGQYIESKYADVKIGTDKYNELIEELDSTDKESLEELIDTDNAIISRLVRNRIALR
jgi:dephospho-CoA kinase